MKRTFRLTLSQLSEVWLRIGGAAQYKEGTDKCVRIPGVTSTSGVSASELVGERRAAPAARAPSSYVVSPPTVCAPLSRLRPSFCRSIYNGNDSLSKYLNKEILL